MSLKAIAQEMLHTTRFGCDIIRLTRPKPKKVRKGKKGIDEEEEEVFKQIFESHLNQPHKREDIPMDQVPYGPIQVRFCQGAQAPIDPTNAKQIAIALENSVRNIIAPYRTYLVNQVKNLLVGTGDEDTERILQYCEWIDALDGQFLQVNIIDVEGKPPQATMSLSAAWVCYVEEDEEKRAEEIARQLKGVFATTRTNRLSTLAQQLAKALDTPPVQG